MTAMTVFRYELQDLRRSRWVMGYTLCLLLLTEALLRFGGGGPRAVLSLMNVVLGVVPLVGIVFGTLYLYGSRSFIQLLLAQPVGRGELFAGLYAGLALPLAAGFLLGVGLPFLWDGDGEGSLAGPLLMLLGTGTFWANKEFYETQYRIIQSTAVGQRTAEKLGLQYDPDYAGAMGPNRNLTDLGRRVAGRSGRALHPRR